MDRSSLYSPTRPIPSTSLEWKKLLARVKREYIAAKYQACSALCRSTLDAAKGYAQVEPAYLIYLHFYAASTLDIQARALHQNAGPLRMRMLRQARDHYRNASKLAFAEEDAMARPLHCSWPVPPSLHSPSSSVSSCFTEPMSGGWRTPSRTSSTSSRSHKRSTGRKKSVTFSDDIAVEYPLEPLIRPDSPTLGFDETFGRTSPSPLSPEPMIQPLQLGPSSILHFEEAADESSGEDDPVFADVFTLDRSIHRYSTILSTLSRQISCHLESIQIEIAAAQQSTTSHMPTEELRSLELRTRIARLRATGWQRRRFDAKRYQILCETAMADLYS
ncbi:hypothetical protein B0I35DRAFT_40926 [Stachybotrys elegans]|uniref:Uncharacterized protein n=1 Tax=Stachybotrys elegans TaxID=80388 RepID=A0A8K0T3M6_9HYPO|nr:hypothetical protein B0I35DRAFT_40926 [Stachybotrys elegans]